MRLNGKLALITGAASGIGEAGAKLFAREGATVALIDRDEAGLERLRREVAAEGGRVETIAADISTAAAARDVVAKSAERLGGLDIVWCNAGILGVTDVEGLSADEYEKSIAVNQSAVIMSTSEAIPHLRARGGGSIIITSSTSGIVGAASSPTYSAAKFAVVGWTKSLAQRVSVDRIRINAICPGPIATPLMKKAMKDGTGHMTGEEYSARILGGVPLGRLGEPIEIAHAALWLASDESTYVTGIALPVDGGYTAR